MKNAVDVNINPCKMCMPMGASLAIKGIEKSIILMHGSQGCSTYIRRHMAQHYDEPVDIASSALSERDTVYGGGDNLKKALKNVIKIYKPKTIGVITTCLAETIGEDINKLISEFMEEEEYSEDDLRIFSAATPGYGGSQFEGYYTAVRMIIEKFAKESKKHKKVNIIPGILSPGDIREIKRIIAEFGVEAIILPDNSETLDAPYEKEGYKKLPDGGTSYEEMEQMSGSIATIEMGILVKDNMSPGKYLEDKYNVPLYRVPIPIGFYNSDLFVDTLKEIYEMEIPETLKKERGRMLDAMIDSHKHNAEGKVAIFGEPELVCSISDMCIENGIIPKVIATGADTKRINEYFKEKLFRYGNTVKILDDTDFETIAEYVESEGVNLLIGHSDGKFVSDKQGIPLIRVGFPIHDRVGVQRQVKVGYFGSMDFMDRITNTLLDMKYSTFRKRMYEKYYKGEELKEGLL